MKHFIDLGTHKFEGLRLFTKKLNINKNWNVYCFEPDPETYTHANEVYSKLNNNYKSLIFENKAISDHNGTTTFYCSRDTSYKKQDGTVKVLNNNKSSEGSTLHQVAKSHLSDNRKIEVTTSLSPVKVALVDIDSLVSTICESDPDAKIYIKCDIEGEEFNVLPRLLSSSHISKLKYIAIEWHERFWIGDKDQYKQKLTERKEIEQSLKQLSNVEYVTHF